MPTILPQVEAYKEPLLLRDRATDQLPVILSPRQYGLLIAAVCVLLLLPSLLLFAPREKPGEILGLFISTSLSITLQLSVHLMLRYANTAWRRWLDQRVLWLNVLVRMSLSLAIATTCAYLDLNTNGFWGLDKEFKKQQNATASQVFDFVIVLIQLAVETLERSQYLVTENERLLQQQLQARYESLKQQLSPHFLFNSLSTLDGLIDEDPTTAKRFLGGISTVYRYLLRHGEHASVPLHEELAFVRSYCYLLQMRFGESLQLDICLPKDVQQRQLPPLALQLLVENAVKHNILTTRQPLHITIEFQAPATLLVCNTLRPRRLPEAGSGLGLSNLASRIRMLHHRDLLVKKTSNLFCVHVPLPA